MDECKQNMETSKLFYYKVIDSSSKLENILADLENEKIIGVDLEADSLFHFNEKVCLIQIAAKSVNVVIDTLKIEDMSVLRPLFSSHNIKKVFHGSDFDVRSLYRDFCIEINNLFDTQVACMFLGLKKTGLEDIIKSRFNVCLDKKYQKKDWSQRPLPKEMLDYAANDARYLIPLAEILKKEVEKIGRLSWVYEECECLSKVRPNSNHTKPLFLKFKGAGLLDSRSLAVLEALLDFRLKTAKKKDKPPFKIVSNNSLINMAKAKPSSKKQLKKITALREKQMKMYGNALIETIKKALEIPKNALPVYPRKTAPADKIPDPKRVKALKKWRNLKAKDLNITPGLLCNNDLICQIALANPKDHKEIVMLKNIKDWQANLFGKEIIKTLSQFCNL